MLKKTSPFYKKIVKIGHRGACGYEPENTLSSFEKAINLGVDAVEFDVLVCKSGEVVVSHDDNLARMAGLNEKISDKTLDELKAIDIGEGEKSSTLEEVLNLINGRIAVNIELKDSASPEPTAEIIKKFLNNGAWSEDDFIVSSFNFGWLKRFVKKMPQIKIGALVENLPIDYKTITEKLKAFSVNPPLEFVDDSFMKKARSLGLKVMVWTVNNPSDIAKAKKLGVDGIFSDFPDRL